MHAFELSRGLHGSDRSRRLCIWQRVATATWQFDYCSEFKDLHSDKPGVMTKQLNAEVHTARGTSDSRQSKDLGSFRRECSVQSRRQLRPLQVKERRAYDVHGQPWPRGADSDCAGALE